MTRYQIAKGEVPVPDWESPLTNYPKARITFSNPQDHNFIIKNGEPCSFHQNCLSHTTHPCEGCGRVAGQGTVVVVPNNYLTRFENRELVREKYSGI